MVSSAERVNRRLGHENLGALSGRRGFLPLRPPALALPPSHRRWDDAAAQLPELLRTLGLRRLLDDLPALPADAGALPDRELPRAATVLGMLGHGYAYAEAGPAVPPPDSIAVPWQQVRRRLGRRGPSVLSYTDLIVHNWRMRDGASPDDLSVPDLRLLVPAVDTQDEHVFYLTQLEILARCTPVLAAVVRAQDGVVRDDPSEVGAALAAITGALGDVTRRSLPRIDPHPSSPTHVDPVAWAKTVAPFAVPLQPGVLGPSGTASPVFNLLDAFLVRREHVSQLGQEIRQHRASYPAHWRRLLAAVEQVSVPAYVERRSDRELQEQLAGVLDAYAGPDGFLGRHRRKVVGYLEVAFKVGRGVTIGGFTGAPADRTWREVDDALADSGAERGHLVGPPGQPDRPSPRLATTCRERPADRGVTVTELSRHDGDGSAWIAVAGRVHDVSGFVGRHPGGAEVLRAYAGIDATAAFARAHRAGPSLERRRQAVDIGALLRPDLPDAPRPHQPDALRRSYDRWVSALFLVVELRNALRLDRSSGRGTLLCRSDGEPPTAYQVDRALDTLRRYEGEHLPGLTARVLLPLAGQGAAADRPLPRSRPAPGQPLPLLRTMGSATCCRRRLDALDGELAGLADLLRTGVAVFERGGDAGWLTRASRSAGYQLGVALEDRPVVTPSRVRSAGRSCGSGA